MNDTPDTLFHDGNDLCGGCLCPACECAQAARENNHAYILNTLLATVETLAERIADLERQASGIDRQELHSSSIGFGAGTFGA